MLGSRVAASAAADAGDAQPQQRETLEFSLFGWNELIAAERAAGGGTAPSPTLLADASLVFNLIPEEFLHAEVLGFLGRYYEQALEVELAALPPRDSDEFTRHVHLALFGTAKFEPEVSRLTAVVYLSAVGKGCVVLLDPDKDPQTFAVPFGRQELARAIQSKKTLTLPAELRDALKQNDKPPRVVWTYGVAPPQGLPAGAEISASWDGKQLEARRGSLSLKWPAKLHAGRVPSGCRCRRLRPDLTYVAMCFKP